MSRIMRIEIFIVTVFTALGQATSYSSIDQCPSQLPRNSHLKVFQYDCYTFHLQERVSVDVAQQRCSQSGGNLVSIDHKDTETFLKSTLNNEYSHGNNYAWIGMRWNNSLNAFKWVDGSPKSYLNFDQSPYKRVEKECQGISAQELSWKDLPCDKDYGNIPSRNGFICRYPIYPLDKCPSSLKRNRYLKAFGDHCFVFETEKLKFSAAEYSCKRQGGKLAMLKTDAMFDFIFHHLKTTFDDYSKNSFTLGGKFERKKGHRLYWLDGTQVAHQPKNYPSYYDYRDVCVAISSQLHAFHLRMYCVRYLNPEPFICQFEVEKDVHVTIPTSSPPIDTTCPPTLPRNDTLKAFGNKCYAFHTKERVSFNDAQKFCRKDHGHLVMPISHAVNKWIAKELKQYRLERYAWIGIRYPHQQGIPLTWVDRTLVGGFTKFTVPFLVEKDPKNMCATIRPFDGFWELHKCNCTSSDGQPENCLRPFVCQYESSGTSSSPAVITTVITPSPVDATTTKQQKKKSCELIACENDCGLYGFKTDPVTQCIMCECDTKK